MTESPIVSKRILYLVSLNHFINDGSTSLISTLFPAVVLAFGFSKFEVGILVAIGYLMNMIFQPIAGGFSEKVEARKLLALGISLIAVSMFLFTISSTFAAMLLSISLLRIGSSFFHPVGVAAVSRTYVGPQLDKSMGFESAFGNLGILAVFAISATIYLTLGWKGPFILFALLDFLTVAVTLSLFPKTRNPPISQDHVHSEPRNIVQRVKKLRVGLPIFFVATQFVAGGAFAVFSTFGNFLLESYGLSLVYANYLIGLWVGASFVGALATGTMSRFVSRKKLLIASFLISSITTLAFALLSGNLGIAIASLVMNGFFISLTYPIMYSELSAYLGDKSTRKGASFGILFSAQIFGSSVLGLLCGYIATDFGLPATFEVVAVLLLVAVASSILWEKSSRKIALATSESI